ncbi:PeriCentriolar MatriX Deficient [Caenorhabditis elegans]|uniref:PeriCentriolar MatriX Deficient n=1 Tax=Caenorhabditis elegans TaxID=6239 RepID=O62071_CAEEL|nr:PeriCentriolar MatriX Deficient [Caenorhabditis elegans]CAB03895.3 PeriCentriolar MatriX Deficient [Caenorhabditis elegans]|eukprot:NP_492959.2 Uncharacterized protein CELE_C17D12.7 [Caenorhabditis elegans]
MEVEYDEGFDSSSLKNNPASLQRDYPTFMESNCSQMSVRQEFLPIFPQRLDLCQISPKKSEKKSKKKKIPSPIKKTNDTKLSILSEKSEIRSEKHKNKCKSADLDAMEKNFKELLENFSKNAALSNSLRDEASSIISSSASSQKSLFKEINLAKKLSASYSKKPEKTGEKSKNCTFSDSTFRLSSQNDSDSDDTRPPSSQASLAFEVEQARNMMMSSAKIPKPLSSSTPRKERRTTGTNSDSIRLSESQLVELYSNREPRNSKSDITIRQFFDEEDDADKTIVEQVFKDYHRSLEKETPIMRNSATDTSGSLHIERNRDGRSASMSNLISNSGNRTNLTVFDGFAPGALRHSISTVQMSPTKKKFDEFRIEHQEPGILPRFVIKTSLRPIFSPPLDIDEICGKGLRKDAESNLRHFGGKTISAQIHGSKPVQRRPTVPKASKTGSDRPTTASTAKIVEKPEIPVEIPQKLEISRKIAEKTLKLDDFPVKSSNFSNISNFQPRRPPYCSATSSDGSAHSLATVTQQLMGTVKLLHPDWLDMLRRLLNNALPRDDVTLLFKYQVLAEKDHLERKFRGNLSVEAEAADAHLEHFGRISTLNRVLDRLADLTNDGGHVSRIQQIKIIHNALFKD